MLSTLLGGAALTGCSEENPKPTNGEGDQNPTSKPPTELYYANMFGKEAMSTYYYWNKEISSDLDNWNIETNNDPIGTVDRIRYHQGDKYIDKWSMLTDDMASFNSSVEGVSTTFGWNLTFYPVNKEKNQYVAVVNFVHEGTPAAKAEFKRGDIILSINDEKITPDNYTDLYYKPTLKVSLGKLQENIIVSQNKSIELTAVNMYENPIICDSVYEFNGKKVGYLAYTSFDLKSINPLIEIGKKFKAEGIDELVLDLRYNGGGYVITENVLASMFAPQESIRKRNLQQLFERKLPETRRKSGNPFHHRIQLPGSGSQCKYQRCQHRIEKNLRINRFRIGIRIRSTAWRTNALYKRSTHRHTDTRQVLHRVDAQRRRYVRKMSARAEKLGNLCNGQHLPECRWKNSLYA